MQPVGAFALEAAGKAVTELVVARGAGEQAEGESAEVKAGAAGDDGEMAALGDFLQGGAGLAGVVAGGEGVIGCGDVDEVVGNLGALGEGGFGGAEVHAEVDGYGVATDDFALEFAGEGEGEGGFAAAGGPEDQDGQWVVRIFNYHRRHQPGGKSHPEGVWRRRQARTAAAVSRMPMA